LTRPVSGFSAADCAIFTGDDIAHVVTWKSGADVSRLVGMLVRLRFVMKDADVYSIRFK